MKGSLFSLASFVLVQKDPLVGQGPGKKGRMGMEKASFPFFLFGWKSKKSQRKTGERRQRNDIKFSFCFCFAFSLKKNKKNTSMFIFNI